ncbi:MAG: winged helix-turn-helix domain-containing protein, partial [Sciscionella sp.]
ADGYVVKPFSFVVLVAQINALLRRSAAAATRRRSTVGELSLDRGSKVVRWRGEPVSLSPREYAVLDVLMARAGTVLGKDELLREVWGDESAATRNAVEVYVGYLRRKLEAAGAGALLRTIRGHGYLLSSPELDSALATAAR